MSEKPVDLNTILKKIELGEISPEEGSRYIQGLGRKQEPKPMENGVAAKEETQEKENKLIAFAEEYLKKTLSNATGLPLVKIDPKLSLEEYGVDSVVIMEMNEQLEKDFKKLPKTLMFEYGSLSELAGYFAKNHAEILNELSGGLLNKKEENKVKVAKVLEEPKTTGVLQEQKASTFRSFRTSQPKIEKSHGLTGEIEDIAIIGINGIFPKAEDLNTFWDNLKNGVDCITEVPSNRWDHSRYYDPEPGKKGKVYSKWGGFIDAYNQFDPLFFQLTPKDAELLDPQERVFLQCVHGAIEDAGYTRKTLWNSKTGVFVGVMYGHYQLYGAQESLKGNIMSLSSSYASIANRVSYFYNFHGPSIAMDTMCSSSLTALHLACESLYRGDSETAIVGGVNLTIHPDKYLFLCGQHFASSEGKCRAFGAGGNGYVPGEGAGALLLKPLKKAQEDNDYIYGVIKATAINHGGKTNGYTVPNPNAQTQVIEDALKKGHVNPRDISYVEAHGTGTSLGDPIEITGLTKAYAPYTQKKQYCAIGSVKTNVGHLESAAGVVSIIKVLLQMKYKQLVPSLHSEVLNPNIDFESTPFYVQRSLSEWKAPEIIENGTVRKGKRCAGISSFGAGGTNVHVILEEYDNQIEKEGEQELEPYIFAISAKNKERLEDYCRKVLTYIERNTIVSMEKMPIKKADAEDGKEYVRKALEEITGVSINSLEEADTLGEFGLQDKDYILLQEKILNILQVEVPFSILHEGAKMEQVISFIEDKKREEKNAQKEEMKLYDKAHVSYGFTLKDLCYTFQNGREPMEERLAVCVHDLPELTEYLKRYLQGNTSEHGIWCGNGKKEKDVVDILSNEGNSIEFLKSLANAGKMDSLCRLWVSGLDIAWKKVMPEAQGRKIPVPSYPFEKKAYWYTEEEDVFTLPSHVLTPVIDSNESVLEQQYYKKTLTSRDFYLRDHVVQGNMVLPGVVYLEMMYQAACLATHEECTITLKNIKWVRAIELMSDTEEKEIYIGLDIAGDYLEASVYSLSPSGTKIIHASCDVWYEEDELTEYLEQNENMEITSAQCTQILTQKECYQIFESIQIDYGIEFQVIERLEYGTSCAYAKLNLSEKEAQRLQDKFVLHPSLMDGAMQTALCFITNSAVSQKTYVPVGLEAVLLHRPLTQTCYCVVKEAETDESEPIYNLFLFDQDEQLSVSLLGLTGMEFGQSSHSIDEK